MKYIFTAIGNPVYDLIITPYVSTKDRVLSGCSVNACLVTRKLGLKNVNLIGFIGEDFKVRFIRDLHKYGINIPKLMICRKTGGFKLIYKDNWDRDLEVLGVADKISIDNLSDEHIETVSRSDFLLIGPILKEVDLDLIRGIREFYNGEIFLDPQGLIRTIEDGLIKRVCDRSELKEIIKLVNIVKPNEFEAEVITGMKTAEEAAKKLVEWGADIGIVTLGENGSIAYDGNELFKIPPYKTLSRDPTGAGDTYAGAFIFKKLCGSSVQEACEFASAAASVKVEYTGPDFPLSVKMVERRCSILRENVILE